MKRPVRGRFERAGLRVLTALVWVAIVAALVLAVRMALWGELISAFRGEAAVSEKVGADSKVKRASRSHSEKGRVDGKTPKAAKVADAPGQEKDDPVASQSATPQKVEKLPATQDQPPSERPLEQIGAKNSDDTVLVINSHTPSNIYVNGQYSGITPRTIKLNTGDYQIRLIADGYEDWTRRIRLKNKQQVEINASMKKKGSQEK